MKLLYTARVKGRPVLLCAAHATPDAQPVRVYDTANCIFCLDLAMTAGAVGERA